MSEWKKVKIGDVCKIVKGTTGIASAEPGKYPLVVTAVERKTCSTYQFDCEAVCIPLVSSSGHGKKSLNNVHYQSGKFALGTILCAVIPNNPDELDARYLHQYLQFYKDTVLVPLMKGAANVSLSMKDIAGIEVPLPPIEKQRELSAMFVSLQEKSLEFKKETDKQIEYVKLLRQSILQDAIEGKLTEYWRKKHPLKKGDPDYDAEALFEKIQAEMSEAESTKKSLAPISKDEIPFEIPTGWKWVRLGEICRKLTDGSHNPPPNSRNGYPVISAMNIKNGRISLDNVIRYTDENGFQRENKRTSITKGDIIMGIIGASIGNVAIYDHDKKVIAQRSIAIIDALIDNVFVLNALNSIFIQKYLNEKAFGSAQGGIYLGKISNIPFPLPSLAEQKEIVARVEQHLQTITQLETQIATRETTTKQLMQSILKDAFEEK